MALQRIYDADRMDHHDPRRHTTTEVDGRTSWCCKGLLASMAKSTNNIVPSSDHIIVTLQEPLKGAQSAVAIPLNLELLPRTLQTATQASGIVPRTTSQFPSWLVVHHSYL